MKLGVFTLIFLAVSPDDAMIELTYNWDEKTPYSVGRNFGHIAFEVDHIYQFCTELQKRASPFCDHPVMVVWLLFGRPIKSPLNYLKGPALPKEEPWVSMPSIGEW